MPRPEPNKLLWLSGLEAKPLLGVPRPEPNIPPVGVPRPRPAVDGDCSCPDSDEDDSGWTEPPGGTKGPDRTGAPLWGVTTAAVG